MVPAKVASKTPWGASGEVRERSWGALVSSKATFGLSGGASGCFGDVSGRLLGAPVAPSEVSWGVLGASQGGF